MRLLLIISLSLLLVLSPGIAAAGNQAKICLTGRVEKNFPSYKQALINSVQLAVGESEIKNQIIIGSFFYDDRPLSSIEAYHNMLTENCSAIIGFEYLSDLLLVQKIQEDSNIPIFTSYASGLYNSDFKENIFIFRPSYSDMTSLMLKFLQHKYGKISPVLLVTQVSRDSMTAYKAAYIRQFKRANIGYDTFDFVENDIGQTEKIKTYINTHKKNYKFIFLLSGAIDSAKIVNTIDDNSNIYIGTENFGSSSASSFYLQLNNKKTKAYFIRNLDFVDADDGLRDFSEKYKKKFKSGPLLISAYTYDATKIILETYREFGVINKENIVKIKYRGVTGVEINKEEFFHSKKYIILESTEAGYLKGE